MRCTECHTVIPESRLAALPHATTCVSCSSEEPLKGVMLWDHKTAPYIHVVTPQQHTRLKQHDRRSVHSHMPMGARTVTGMEASVARSLTPSSAVVHAADTRPRARKCPHKTEAQASWYGMCLECSLDWYARRVQ
jgi:rare lipoprotein A (peptidoglycan hydrolase)